MKIQLDTDAKTIKIEGDVNMKEFLTKIKKLLPDEWESYKLQTNVTINNCHNPVYIPVPSYPIWREFYYQTGLTTTNLNVNGRSETTISEPAIYNIEC